VTVMSFRHKRRLLCTRCCSSLSFDASLIERYQLLLTYAQLIFLFAATLVHSRGSVAPLLQPSVWPVARQVRVTTD
jgi:hypothetical protein